MTRQRRVESTARVSTIGLMKGTKSPADRGPKIYRLLRHVAITRQGALAGARYRIKTAEGPTATARGVAHQLMLIGIGSTLIGIGVALFTRSNLGLPPYDVLLSAVKAPLGVSHGQAAWAVSALLFTIATLLGQRPSIYGVVFMFTNGLAVDAAVALVVEPADMGTRVAYVLGALVALAAGIAIATSTNTTGGPFELLMNAGQARGMEPYRVRTALELGVLIGGVAGGGNFGPATVVLALSIGSIIRIWSLALVDHREGRSQRLAAKASGVGESDGADSRTGAETDRAQRWSTGATDVEVAQEEDASQIAVF